MRERRKPASDTEEAGTGTTSSLAERASADDVNGEPADRRPNLASWVFAGLVAAALPLILFKLGRNRWFVGDDFWFTTHRKVGSLNDLFSDFNSHWSTVPVLVFRTLWAIFGFRTYLPYQFCVVVLHLSAVVLLRLIMRRAGVGPWIATAASTVLLFFGPAEEDIVWAFQIGFTGALVFGLLQLVLADHEGPVDRRDGYALLAGLLALMSSGVGVTMVVIVAAALLVRRGWRVALLQTAPLAVAYLVWLAVTHPDLSSPRGRPTLGTLARWLRSAEDGTFVGLGHFRVVAVLLAVLLIAGLALIAVQSSRSERGGPGLLRAVRRVACPLALLFGGLVFSTLTAQSRWGRVSPSTPRYLYLEAAFTLPTLAVAAEAFARRWRLLTPALAALFLVAVPFNIRAFGAKPFSKQFFESEKKYLTTAVRMPFARQVPASDHPIPDVPPQGLTIGFLLRASETGKLRASTGPVPAEYVNELKVRLGVSQTFTAQHPSSCSRPRRQLDLRPVKGTVYVVADPILISTVAHGKVTSEPVPFAPVDGRRLTIELPDLQIRLRGAGPSRTFRLCRP